MSGIDVLNVERLSVIVMVLRRRLTATGGRTSRPETLCEGLDLRCVGSEGVFMLVLGCVMKARRAAARRMRVSGVTSLSENRDGIVDESRI